MARVTHVWRTVRMIAAAGIVSAAAAGTCQVNVPSPVPPGGPAPTPTPPGPQPGTGSENAAPVLTFLWPATNITIQDGTPVLIRYNVKDPDNNPRANVFVDYQDPATSQAVELVIAQGRQLTAGSADDALVWNTAGLPAAVYTVRAVVTDDVNAPVTVVAPGQVTIQPRPVEPPAPPPPPPPPNVSPTLRLIRPVGTSFQVEAGTPLVVEWETTDFDDFVLVSVKAEYKDPGGNPANNITQILVDRRREPTSGQPGRARDSVTWDTTGQQEGVWDITVTAREDRANPNPDPTPGTAKVRIIPAGTQPLNGPPVLDVALPASETGLSHDDLLDIAFLVKDPNSDIDQIAINYMLDRDRDAGNDATDPTIPLGGLVVPAGVVPPNQFIGILVDPPIVIDLAVIPPRLETDEGGRPLPYYLRIKADDGKGGVVNQYAPGPIRILVPAGDVVDLLHTGGRVAGARFQGFHGEPFNEGRGAQAGSAFAGLGDFDGDGINDFAIAARTATPFNRANVGITYLIYGRARRVDLNQQFARGRYSGVNDLNSVGSFIPFPPTDPLFETIFNIRGTQLFHPAVGPGGSAGISDIAGWPDITDDGLPELLMSTSFADSVLDRMDNDPCDECTFPVPPFPQWVCFTNPTEETLDSEVDGIPPGNVAAGMWLPRAPTAPAVPNVDLDLDDKHLLTIRPTPSPQGPYGLEVCVNLTGVATPPPPPPPPAQPPDFPVTFDIYVQLEPTVDRGDGTMIHGPCLRKTITVCADGESGEFEYDCASPPAQPPDCMNPSTGPADPVRYVPSDPQFPVPLDPTGNVGNGNCAPPPTEGQPIPVSCYDGQFSVYFQWNTVAGQRPITEFEIQDINVTVVGTTAEEEEHDYAYTYRDGFPDERSNLPGCGGETPAPVSWYGAAEIQPACPPANDDRFSASGIAGYMCGAPSRGNALAPPLGLLGGAEGPQNDDLYPGPPHPTYQSGLVYVAASDDLQIPQFGNGAGGTPNRVAEIGEFGQGAPRRRGARIRGAWYQPDIPFVYDPASGFGHKIDTMPDMNASVPGYEELVVSSPGTGVCSTGSADLSATLGGGYSSMAGTAMMSRYNFLDPLTGSLTDCNIPPTRWTFSAFSKVTGATLTIFGTAAREARVQVQLLRDTPFGPQPIPGTSRRMLLWPGDVNAPNGDYELQEHVNAPFVFDPLVDPFSLPIVMQFPRGAFGSLRGVNSEDAGIWVELSILPDCTVTPGDVDGNPAMSIRQAVLTVTGLAPNVGMVTLFNGEDVTFADANTADGDEEGGWPERPVSWPLTDKDQCGAPNYTRRWVFPTEVLRCVGRFPNDQLGFAGHAGDLDLDGVPDMACGAPGADTDPDNAGGPRLDNNGQSFVLFGSQSPPSGPIGPPMERFEIRGSHDGDQFGRVQGNIGDFNGDSNDDTYFASEFYDLTGSVGGVPMPDPGPTGIRQDAGFVGIMFGNPTLTGEVTVRAERIGTGNFLGVKFIGGSAGARIGNEMSTGEDFNLDGFGDILITSPGQTWQTASIAFRGNVADGNQIVINGIVFEYDTETPANVTPGATRLDVTNSTSPLAAERALLSELRRVPADTSQISALSSQIAFPDPLPDDPTVTFTSRTPTGLGATTTAAASVIEVKTHTRQGVTYLIFGSRDLQNKTFVLPDDLNRRDPTTGKRILKGVVFVGAYEADNPSGPVTVNFDPGGVRIGDPIVQGLATFSGGVEGPSPLALSAPNAYVITGGTPAVITFQQQFPEGPKPRPACEFSAYFVYDPGSGATGATMTARDPNGIVVATARAVAPGVPPPPPVAIRSPGSISTITITVEGPAGSTALIDNAVLGDPTPDAAAVTRVVGVGDVDADGWPDIMLGAPSADFINVLEPCNRRKSAGEVYLIYGNNFGPNDGTAP